MKRDNTFYLFWLLYYQIFNLCGRNWQKAPDLHVYSVDKEIVDKYLDKIFRYVRKYVTLLLLRQFVRQLNKIVSEKKRKHIFVF